MKGNGTSLPSLQILPNLVVVVVTVIYKSWSWIIYQMKDLCILIVETALALTATS